MQIYLAIYKILVNKDFTITDNLISQLFVIIFIHLVYIQITFI